MGKVGGCLECGTPMFEDNAPLKIELPENWKREEIPPWYRTEKWDDTKIAEGVSPQARKVAEYVTKILAKEHLEASFMILLPEGCGKRIALFNLIDSWEQRGKTVRKTDILSFKFFSESAKREYANKLYQIITADLTVVYGTDFQTKKLSSKLFFQLARKRALYGKPTVMFAGDDHQTLSQWDDRPINLDDNKINNCKLSNPLVLDGVVRRN
jgi:hypothetical protein